MSDLLKETHDVCRTRTGIARFCLALLGVVAVGLALHTLGGQQAKPSKAAGIVVVPGAITTGPSPKPESPQMPAGFAAMPEAPSKMRHALALADDVVILEATEIDRENGVTCGRLRPSAALPDPRRFVYVGVAMTGRVDDGSADFEEYRSMVCDGQIAG